MRPGAPTVVVSSRALPATCAGGGGCPMQEGYMIRDPRLEPGAPLIEPAELRRDGSRLGEDSSCTMAFLKRSIESAPGKSARVARMARSPTPPTIPPPGTSPCTGPSTIAASRISTYFPYILWALTWDKLLCHADSREHLGKNQITAACGQARKSQAYGNEYTSRVAVSISGSPLCSMHSL